MSVRYHLDSKGELRPCYASIRPCPYKVHYDFFNDESAIVYKVASQLSKADPSNQGLKDLIEQAKAGKQLAFDQIAYVMETRSLKKNRDRIGLASVKKLSALLYRMGRTFDGLNTDRISTEDFLRTGNPELLSSKSNKELLNDLTDASTFVMETDYNVTPIDLDFARNVNARIRRTGALKPGIIRTTEPAYVDTTLGSWKAVDSPNLNDLSAMIAEAVNKDNGPLMDRAVQLFCKQAKMQPFGDGNKRTALLMANAVTVSETNGDVMVSVPADNMDDVHMFNELLSRWYVKDDLTIMQWMARWNDENPITD